MMNRPGISVIGTGALGSVLAQALQKSGWPVKSLYNRSATSAVSLAEELGVQMAGEFPSEKQELGRIIFLTVLDGAIEETSNKLAALDADFSGYTVFHCSGTQPSSALQSVGKKGARTASFHPIQTFVEASNPVDFEEIVIDVEARGEALEIACNVAGDLGASVLEVSPHAKPYLHAAGVIASNYMISLVEAAGQAAALGGLGKKDAQKALVPLMQKSLANISESDCLTEALSGPVARGDTTTVDDHIKLLKQNEQLASLYKQLGSVLVQLLNEKNELTDEKITEISKVLSE